MDKSLVEPKIKNKKNTKRLPLEKIPVSKGTGKAYTAVVSPVGLSMGQLVFAGMFSTLLSGLAVYGFILKKDEEEHEKAKNEVFDVISDNCSSLGVNKMAIVDKVSKMIRKERLSKKSEQSRVKELEEFILNYNSLSESEILVMKNLISMKNEKNKKVD